jgi:hypothetical protein
MEPVAFGRGPNVTVRALITNDKLAEKIVCAVSIRVPPDSVALIAEVPFAEIHNHYGRSARGRNEKPNASPSMPSKALLVDRSELRRENDFLRPRLSCPCHNS